MVLFVADYHVGGPEKEKIKSKWYKVNLYAGNFVDRSLIEIELEFETITKKMEKTVCQEIKIDFTVLSYKAADVQHCLGKTIPLDGIT